MAAGRHVQRRRPVGVRAGQRSGRHRRPPSPRSRATALVVVPLVLGTGTAAYAYWSASGSGSATLSTATATAITVTATPSGTLFPGASADVSVTMGNPNAYPVSMTTMTAISVTSSDSAACASSWISLPAEVTTGVSGTGYVLPSPVSVPSGSSGTTTLTGLVTMATDAPDTCQGKTFTVDMTFTGDQVA